MKMTREQLNQAIKELRGQCAHRNTKPGFAESYNPVRTTYCVDCGLDLECDEVRNYLADADAMLELLRDTSAGWQGKIIHTYTLSSMNNGLRGSYCCLYALRPVQSGGKPLEIFLPEEGREIEAAALAWYEWKTGVRVELVEDSNQP